MRLETPALSYSAHQSKEAALWKAQQGQKPKSSWLHTMQWACLPPASSLYLFWNTPSGSHQVAEHWNTASFQQHFHLKFESNKSCQIPPWCRDGPHLPVNSHIHAIQWGNKPLPSELRGSGSYFIYQGYPSKAYAKAMEELGSLSSWEVHCNVSGRSFPQDVWSRWFNHIKFLVLPTWLNTCPLFLQQQQGPFTIPRSNTCPTQGCGQGSAPVSCHRATFQFHSPAVITNSTTALFTFPQHTQSLCFPLWPSCTPAWVKSPLRRTRQTQHTTGALVRLSCFAVVNNSQLEGDPPDRQVWPLLPGTPPEICHLH